MKSVAVDAKRAKGGRSCTTPQKKAGKEKSQRDENGKPTDCAARKDIKVSTKFSNVNEIDEIFGSKKRKIEVVNSGDTAERASQRKQMDKKRARDGERATNVRQRLDKGSTTAVVAKPRKKTLDGFRVYSEDEIGWNRKDAGGSKLCPFDCNCCF